MKNTDEIMKLVKEYIHQSYLGKETIKDDSLIFSEGFFDSMGFVRLISFLEENFNVVIGDEDLIEENFESINAIVDYVQKKSEVSA